MRSFGGIASRDLLDAFAIWEVSQALGVFMGGCPYPYLDAGCYSDEPSKTLRYLGGPKPHISDGVYLGEPKPRRCLWGEPHAPDIIFHF